MLLHSNPLLVEHFMAAITPTMKKVVIFTCLFVHALKHLNIILFCLYIYYYFSFSSEAFALHYHFCIFSVDAY